MLTKNIHILICSTVIFAVGCFYGFETPVSELLVPFDVLRQTAIMVFGVVGAWIAVLFPILQSEESSTSLPKKRDVQKLIVSLFKPVKYAIYILSATLLFPILHKIFIKMPIPIIFAPYIRGTVFGGLCLLTAFQLYTILLALTPFDITKTKASLAIEKMKAHDRLKKKEF